MAKLRPMMILPPVLFAVIAGVFAYGVLFGGDRELPSAMRGKPAPVVPQTTLTDFPPFVLEDLADGEIKLVNFFASWCGPCRVEHPNLEMLAEQGLAIYAVNYKDKPDGAEAFLNELGNPYEGIVTDPDGRAALQWGVYGVPETFIVDGAGKIIDRMAGPVTTRMIDARLRPALDGTGQTLN